MAHVINYFTLQYLDKVEEKGYVKWQMMLLNGKLMYLILPLVGFNIFRAIRGIVLTDLAGEIVEGLVFTIFSISLRFIGMKKKFRPFLVPAAMLVGYVSFTEYLITYDELDHAGPKAVFVITACWAMAVGTLVQSLWLYFVIVLSACTIM
jgi:hypothetical protein